MLDSGVALEDDLIRVLRSARRVAALSGAGISAESGVPTFRDAQKGLWAEFDPAELATPEAFARNPKFVWDWYAMRRQTLAQVEPNAGHHALVSWAQRCAEFTVITQNVDGLHQRAGSDAVIELHGNILRVRCSAENVVVDDWREVPDDVPRCGQCAAYLRPDVVWFGEMLPMNALARAEDAVATADLVLSIGTSSLVQPAAQLPYRALEAGITVVEINPEETPLSVAASFSLRGPAGRILPALLAALED